MINIALGGEKLQNSILTPITLWEGLEIPTLSEYEVIHESIVDGILFRKIIFNGRKIGEEQIKIFALLAIPQEQSIEKAGLLLLPDMHASVEFEFVKKYALQGYTVLMPDYRGEFEGAEQYTKYPQDISYANYTIAKECIDVVEKTEQETPWYEWVNVALYSLSLLKNLRHIEVVGAVGIRAGGDILWQLAAISNDLACAVSVCAGGWRIHGNQLKHAELIEEQSMSVGQRKFLACLEAQGYAPLIKSPMLMLCACNDKGFNVDRAYDTFARINSAQEKAIYFSTNSTGQLGFTSLQDLDLFLKKYLLGEQIYIPQPVQISLEEMDGELLASIKYDDNAKIKNCQVYVTEELVNPAFRDWRKCKLKQQIASDECLYSVETLKGAKDVFVFANIDYHCGFAISSKITHLSIEGKHYANQITTSKILYSSSEGKDGFLAEVPKTQLLGGVLIHTEHPAIEFIEGPAQIIGISSQFTLKFYRLYSVKDKLDETSLIKFDVYAPNGGELTLTIAHILENGYDIEKYTHTISLQQGEYWSSCIVSSNEFNNEQGKRLQTFASSLYLAFNANKKFCINNIINL